MRPAEPISSLQQVAAGSSRCPAHLWLPVSHFVVGSAIANRYVAGSGILREHSGDSADSSAIKKLAKVERLEGDRAYYM